METTTYSAQLTFLYDDLATRNINFTDVDAEAIFSIKGNILSFNEAISAGGASSVAYKDTFTSDDGAPLNRISKAKYTRTTEEEIYNGN